MDPVLAVPALRGAGTIGWLAAGACCSTGPGTRRRRGERHAVSLSGFAALLVTGLALEVAARRPRAGSAVATAGQAITSAMQHHTGPARRPDGLAQCTSSPADRTVRRADTDPRRSTPGHGGDEAPRLDAPVSGTES